MRAEINLLGPLEATIAGTSIAPTAPKQRQLLALFALNAGCVVTVPTIMEEIWEDNPTRCALSSLQTYILNLRRRLDRALTAVDRRSPKDVLVTGPGGYTLDIPPGDTDVGRYEELAAVGRRAAFRGDNATAARTLDEALRQWRGSALVDVPTGQLLRIEVTRLEESRLSSLDLRIESDLRLGRHRQILDELAMLCARHPWFENFHAQYMLALHRSGRPWRALEVYRQLYVAVGKYLGVEPSWRLRHLHQAMLSGDPVVDDPNFVVSDWVPTPVPVSQRNSA
jgi:DNA-binding SARP family transcriptional activator